MRLRSRAESSVRFQTSSNRTSSVRAASFGAMSPMLRRPPPICFGWSVMGMLLGRFVGIRSGSRRLLLVRGAVLLVRDRLEPLGGVAAVLVHLEHRDVAHQLALGRAVPVLLAGGRPDGLAGADPHDAPVAGADEADPVGDVEGLADGVGVPVGAGTGGEPDDARDEPR